MAGLLLVARSTGRSYTILRALLLAGIIMLLFNPYLLVHDPGFQLSFIATLALILFAPHVEKWLLFIPEKLGLRTIITATIATQIFVLPLLLYHTGLLSSVSVLVNALVLPMVPIAMLLTSLTGVLGIFFEPLGIFFGFITYYSLGYIIFVSEFFGSFSFAATTVTKFPFWFVVIAYVGLAWLLFRLSKKKEHRLIETGDKDDLSGWTIEEEKEEDKEKTGDSQSSSPALPFR
jgi:competence protein ComEC